MEHVAQLDVETSGQQMAWEDRVGPLLSSAEAAARLGAEADSALDKLARAGRVIALQERSGRVRYPAWQFADGRPLEALVAAHRELVETGRVSEWTAASFCVAPHPELGGLSPREFAAAGRDDERLALVARRDAARLAQ